MAQEIRGAFVKCDVSQEADAAAVVSKAVALGKLVGLVNCAGIAPAEKTVGKNGAHALSVFSKTIAVNLIGFVSRSGIAMLLWVTNLVLIPVLAFFFLRDWDRFVERVASLIPRDYLPTVTRLAKESPGQVSRGRPMRRASLAVVWAL